MNTLRIKGVSSLARIIRYKRYTTQAGDTFDSLALGMYHDERQAGEIMNFNPDYAKYIILPAGLSLRLPYLEDTYDGGVTLPPWRRAEELSEIIAADGEVLY